MKRFGAVIAREWAAQRNVALMALPLAGVPWLLALHPSVAANDRRELVAIASAVLGGGFLVILSVALGATVSSVSFYIARPLTATQLWLGRLVADATLVAAASALIGIAALRAWPWAWLALPCVVPLFVIANYIGLVVRARGLGFLADLVLLVAVAALAIASTLPLRWFHAPLAGAVMCAFWIVSWLVSLGVAGIRAVRSGGFDVRLAASVARRVLWRWTVVLAVTLDLGYAFYLVVLPPVHPLPLAAYEIDSNWASVIGFNAGRLDYLRFYLLNTRNGRRIDVHAPARTVAGWPRASADGRHFFWTAWGDATSRLIHVIPDDERIETLPVDGMLVAVAPDGSRVALKSGPGTRIIDVASGREVRHLTCASDARGDATFPDRDHLRLLVLDGRGGVAMRTIDLRSGGEDVVHCAIGDDSPRSWDVRACLLDDGRFVVMTRTIDHAEAHVFRRDGREQHVIKGNDPGGGVSVSALRSVAPGIVSASGIYGTLLFDVDRGTSRLLEGVYTDGGTVFVRKSRILRFDPHTGNETTIGTGESAPSWLWRVMPGGGGW